MVSFLSRPSTLSDHESVCKTPQKLLRAPLESPRSQLSNDVRMNARDVSHTELWSLEIENGTNKDTIYEYLRYINWKYHTVETGQQGDNIRVPSLP